MKVLCVGDVVGTAGLAFCTGQLSELKKKHGVDYTIVNGENADKDGVGLSHHAAESLLQYADVVTTGNHAFRRAGAEMYSENPYLLCPANFPYLEDDAGCCVIDTGRLGSLRVINLIGTAWMEPVDNPFKKVDELLAKTEARFTIVDFHGESTAEKKALGYHLAGRVSAVFGTHTHVQTADEQLLDGKTGYITDVGMTGPFQSVIGVRPEDAVKRQRTHRPVRFTVAEGPCIFNAALFTLNDTTGACTGVERINFFEEIRHTDY